MKKHLVVLAVSSILISSCSNTSSGSASGGGGGVDTYASCDQPPAGSVTQNACPGATGTWNNYEVVQDGVGTVLTNKLWCGGTIADHPASQTAYDGSMVPVGSTSNADYKSSTVCVSGSSTDGSAHKTRHIWQLQ